MFAATSVHSQRVVLVVPVAAAVAVLVGDDSHVGEEPVLVDKLAGVVGRHDGHHPGISLGVVRLVVLGTATERLAVDEPDVPCAAAVAGVVALDVHTDLEIIHVDGLGVERAPLDLHGDDHREVLRGLELDVAEQLSVRRLDLELHLLLAHA